MSNDQIGGIIAIVAGLGMLLLRNYLYVGRDVDVYRPENNLANPNRKPTNKDDRRIIVAAAIVLIVAGLLYALGVLPR